MKLFLKNRITKKSLRKQIIDFAKSKKVKGVYFNNKAKHIKGSYSPDDQTIFLSNKETKASMLRTFFHELSHHMAIKQKKWLTYHFDKKELSSKKMFDAENGVDKIAKNLWNKYVDSRQWGKYKYSYPKMQKRALIKWLSEYRNK